MKEDRSETDLKKVFFAVQCSSAQYPGYKGVKLAKARMKVFSLFKKQEKEYLMVEIIVLATRNSGKLRELQQLLKGFPVDIKSLNDFGPIPEVVEDGETFDDNAYKKALFTAKALGLPAMADDSGLVVAALGGAPGVKSARYAGEGATDQENIEKLLEEMEGEKDRSAAFECVISIAVPSGPALTYEGRCEGEITDVRNQTSVVIASPAELRRRCRRAGVCLCHFGAVRISAHHRL